MLPAQKSSAQSSQGPVRHSVSKRRRPGRVRTLALLATGAAVLTTGVVACEPTATTATATAAKTVTSYVKAGMPAVQARPLDSLADSFGIKVETSTTSGMYGQRTKVMSLLKQMGVRHIRDDFFVGNTGQLNYLNQLHSQLGITSLLALGRPDGRSGSASALVKTAAKIPNDILAFEGTNEWDILGGRNWAPEVRSWQAQIYKLVKSNPALRSKPVYGPSMGRDTTYSQLGNISSWIDYANLHTYPGGQPPSATLSMRLSRSAVNRGHKGVVSTETGYHDKIPTSAGHRPASDTATALYYPRMMLEDLRYGLQRTFGFELIDHGSSSSFRDHLGLVKRNWQPKAQFYALANMLKISSDPGPAFTPGKLSYTISGAPADLQTQLYQKRDGTFMLYVWRDVSVYNQKNYKTINPGTYKVTVKLGKSSTTKVYRPTTSANAQQTIGGSSVSFTVAGEVVALAIK